MHAFFVRLKGMGIQASQKAYTSKETAPNVHWAASCGLFIMMMDA